MSKLAVLALCLSASLAAQAPGKGYVLSFSENFAGDHVDTNVWNFRTDAKALSTQLPRNVSVHDGKLLITPRKEHVAGMEFTGGGVVSKAAFRYGYFQVDAKVTSDHGWHTSFWMMAGDGKTTFPMEARTELDDFEIESPTKVSMGYLVWHNKQQMSSKRCNNAYAPGFSTADAMHTYGLEWTEETLTYFLDGKEICSQPYSPTSGMHDRLNIWLTTLGARKPIDASGTSPAEYQNVRYYVRDYYISATDPAYAEYGKDWHDGPEPGFSNSASRVSCSADAMAVYTPSVLEAGTFNVQLWHVKNSPSTRNGGVEAAIDTANGTEKKVIPAQAPTGWFDLGTFAFNKGATGAVRLSSATGCIQANTVKFLRK